MIYPTAMENLLIHVEIIMKGIGSTLKLKAKENI
jgi:hypothetical protein